MRGFVYVVHYFSPEGSRRFPEMFREHQQRAARYAGFVALHHLKPMQPIRSDGTFTLLEFADEQLLLKWRASEDHKWVAAQYRTHWTRDPDVLLFTSDQ